MMLGFFSITQLQVDLISSRHSSRSLAIRSMTRSSSTTASARICAISQDGDHPLLNLSLNETLSRTLVTSLSIMIALAVLLVLGPDVIFGLTIAILLGTFIGTYSSIYISAPILVWLGVTPDSFLREEEVQACRGRRDAKYRTTGQMAAWRSGRRRIRCDDVETLQPRGPACAYRRRFDPSRLRG
jgi:preprotein translocase subunit SecF